MDKTGQCEAASRTSEDAAPIDDTIVDGWHSWGSCRWGIDTGGTLWITPAAGRTEGTAQSLPKGETWIEPSYGKGAPWRSQSKGIRSVKVLGTVRLVGCANCMFAGLTHCKDMDLTGLDTSGLQDMTLMFDRCLSLTSLDLSGWDTSEVRSMEAVFNDCRGLVNLDLSGWDTSKVYSTVRMFCTCSSLVSLDLSGWDTSSIVGMSSMFSSCRKLVSVDVSSWDMSQAAGVAYMFSNCSSLASLDVSGWDMSGAKEMYYMFRSCSSLTRLDVSGWGLRSPRTMFGLFADCTSLTSLDVSGWDTSKTEAMSGAFYNCSSLTYLDLSSWDMLGARDLGNLLYGCSSLREVRLGPRYSFRPHPYREGAPWATFPDPPTEPPYNGNWVRKDGTGEMSATELAERYEPSLAGTWVRTTDTQAVGEPPERDEGAERIVCYGVSVGVLQVPEAERPPSYGIDLSSKEFIFFEERLECSDFSNFLTFSSERGIGCGRPGVPSPYLNGLDGDFWLSIASPFSQVHCRDELVWFVTESFRDRLTYQDLRGGIVYGGAIESVTSSEVAALLFETVRSFAGATDVYHTETVAEKRAHARDLNPFDDFRYDVYVRNAHSEPYTKTLANVTFHVNCDVRPSKSGRS